MKTRVQQGNVVVRRLQERLRTAAGNAWVCSLSVASLPRALDCTLFFAEVDESGCETGPVGDAREQDLRSLSQLVFEALRARLEHIRDARHREEVLHVMESVSLRVRVREISADLGLAERLARRMEVAEEIV